MEYDVKKEVILILLFLPVLVIFVKLRLFWSLTLCDLFRFDILSVRLHSLEAGNRNCPVT